MFISPTNNYQNYFVDEPNRFHGNWNPQYENHQDFHLQSQFPNKYPMNSYFQEGVQNFPIPNYYSPNQSVGMNAFPENFHANRNPFPQPDPHWNLKGSFEGSRNFNGNISEFSLNNPYPEFLRKDHFQPLNDQGFHHANQLNNSIDIPPRFFNYFEPSPERQRLGLDHSKEFLNRFEERRIPFEPINQMPQRFPDIGIPEFNMVPTVHYPTLPTISLPPEKHVRFLGQYRPYDLQKKFNVTEYKPGSGNASQNQPNQPNQGSLGNDPVFEAIKNMIILEDLLCSEKAKIRNSEAFPFNNVYELFDDNSSGQIVLKEFLNGCKLLGLKNVSSDDATLLIKRVSRDGNLRLSFEEFKRIFFNESNLNQSKVSRRSVKNPAEQDMKIASDILKTHLNVELSCEEIRRNLVRQGVVAKRAFREIDSNNSGSVSKRELIDYLQKKGFSPNEIAFNNFFMKMDRNSSGQINDAEFAFEMEPKMK